MHRSIRGIRCATILASVLGFLLACSAEDEPDIQDPAPTMTQPSLTPLEQLARLDSVIDSQGGTVTCEEPEASEDSDYGALLSCEAGGLGLGVYAYDNASSVQMSSPYLFDGATKPCADVGGPTADDMGVLRRTRPRREWSLTWR